MDAPYANLVVGGRYELETLLGEGAMGAVWQARHLTLGSRVAIKFLRGGLVESDRARDRFLLEARLMAQLASSRVARVFDFGITDEGLPYLVMELVDGETLADRREREGRLAPRLVARILAQAARGLERAHAMGIVHRDFKPDNVLLTLDDDGSVLAKVTDFGVAKVVRTGARPRRDDAAGTPFYMAPEQLEGRADVDASADVWAFGVVAYECITGAYPFRARNLHALLARMHAGAHTKPSLLAPVPRSFDAWFAKACAPLPRDRFVTIRDAADGLAIALGVPAELPAASAPPHRGRSARTSWALGALFVASAVAASIAVGHARRTASRAGEPASAPVSEGSAAAPVVAVVVPSVTIEASPPSIEHPATHPAAPLPGYRPYPAPPPSTPRSAVVRAGFKNDPY